MLLVNIIHTFTLLTGPPANVTLQARSSRSLQIAWDPLKAIHGSFIAYTVQCRSEDLEQSTTVYKLANENVTRVIIERLLPFTTYTCCASIETTMANSTTTCLQQRTPEDGILLKFKECFM